MYALVHTAGYPDLAAPADLAVQGMSMKRDDWILIGAWVLYIAAVGPFLISARDDLQVLTGLVVLAVLLYFTQRRLVSIFKERIK
jgi:hypothetical protein